MEEEEESYFAASRKHELVINFPSDNPKVHMCHYVPPN